jgi:hypothetical protein
MQTTDFDWDKLFASMSLDALLEFSPLLSRGRRPTMYSPDRTRLYLATLDIDVGTVDVAELAAVLPQISDKRYSSNCSELAFAIAKIEFAEVCLLLQNCAIDPTPYVNPDALLESLGRK